MKIVCDACAAKYSIADDKVKGKVFKIRCKKCSNIIVVRGTGPGAAADEPAPAQFDQKETRVYDYGAEGDQAGDAGGDEAVWHVVIDQEQVGPVTAAEIQRRFAGGEIDAETYIWREGFADWQPLSQIDIFASLAAGGSTTAAQPPSSGEDAVASMFGGPAADEGGTMRSDPNDLFAAAAARTADDDGGDDAAGDLFGGGGKAARHAEAEPAERGAKVAAPASGDKRLRGERNENSVLFSLGNLAALASDAPRASAPAAASASSAAAAPGAAAHGGGEGSGLIDIRSMASTYLADKGSARPGGKGAVGSVDDLPVFSTAAFSEPVVIMPTARSGGGDKKVLYALIGVVGLLAVVAVVLVVMVMGGGNKKDSGQVAALEGSGSASGATPGSAGAATGSDGSAGSAAAGSAGSAGSNDGSAGSAANPGSGAAAAGGTDGSAGSGAGAGTAAANPGSAAEPPSRGGSAGSSSRKPPAGGGSGSSGRKPPGGTDPLATPPPPKGGKCSMDEVGCLLAEHPPACCSIYGGKGGGGGGGTSKPPVGGGGGGGGGDSDLPEELDRAAISAGVGNVKSRILGCGDKSSAKGEVKVSVKVSPGGSVASVSVKNTPDAALGNCVAGAIQKATFKKTQKGGSFSYPFIFR